MIYVLMAEEWGSRVALDKALDEARYEWGAAPADVAAQESLMSMMPEG